MNTNHCKSSQEEEEVNKVGDINCDYGTRAESLVMNQFCVKNK